MRRCPQCQGPALDTHQYCPACGGDLRDAPQAADGDAYIGMTIAGKFVLRELVGAGGMGVVYLSDQIGVGRTVAVKIMHRHLLGDETAAARFINEARASSRLNHPNSISILDFGQTEIGMLYIVMEYLRGRSLDVLLEREFPIPFGRVANILCQALDAVETAHNLSIVHRDLKPENIFLEQSTGYDFVKVLDFGVAKMLDLEDRTITTPGLVPGTPEYMSPEQARGEPLDSRSDVYSLGVILYELLTGSVPFKGASALATMMSHVQDLPEPPSRRRPDRQIPEALDALVLWALAKRVEDRIGSAAQLRQILAAWAEAAGLWPSEDARRATQTDLLLKYFPKEQVMHLTGAQHQEVLRPSSTMVKIVPRPRTTAADTDGEGPLVLGRKSERERLRALLEQGGGGRSLRIQATTGMGKHTLIMDAVAQAVRLGFRVQRCQPVSAGWASSSLAVAQQVARRCLGLEDLEPREERLMAAADQLGLDHEDIPGLKELFGYRSHLSGLTTEVRRRERSVAFLNLVHQAAQQSPLLLVFEEIEHYDRPSRELALALSATPCSAPLAIILTHGPRLLHPWPPEMQLLQLHPLEDELMTELLGELFEEGATQELIEHLLDLARGRPLFAEQAAFAYAHEGVYDPPDKVADLVATRVERLPQQERELLQLLAVLDTPAMSGELGRIARSGEEPQPILERLEAKGFLRPTRRGYTFVHHLLALVVYSSIPAEVRRGLHRSVARSLHANSQAAASAVAFHSFEADEGPLAIENLDLAGGQAVLLMDHDAAIQHFRRALEIVRREWGRGRLQEHELEQLTVDLARRLAGVLRQTMDRSAARGVLEEALSIAAGRAESRAGLRYDLGCIDLESGVPQRALRHLELAMIDAKSAGADWLLSKVTYELARALGLFGDKQRSSELLLESLKLSARASGQYASPSWVSLLEAANISQHSGSPERARGYLVDALQQAAREHSPEGKLLVTSRLAELHMSEGEWSEAAVRLTQAADFASQVGSRTHRAQLLVDLGRVQRIQGDVESGRVLLEQAVRLTRKIGWWDGQKRAEQEIEMLKYAVPQAL